MLANTTDFLIRDLLERHRSLLGADFAVYLNHCRRVVLFCRAFAGEIVTTEEIAIAAAFHDLGIWTAGSFDYLAPSRFLADQHLAGIGKPEWSGRIQAMIAWHHKITPYRGDHAEWVEAFRRADWVDVSLGRMRFGLAAGFIQQVKLAYPNRGFHRLLGRLMWRRFLKRPLSPLPMMKW